jgi:hypothetical protein
MSSYPCYVLYGMVKLDCIATQRILPSHFSSLVDSLQRGASACMCAFNDTNNYKLSYGRTWFCIMCNYA